MKQIEKGLMKMGKFLENKKKIQAVILLVAFAVLMTSIGCLGKEKQKPVTNKETKPQGSYTRSDGRKYTGEMEYGMANGYGTMTTPDGRVYEGEWKDDRREGKGTMTWPDGRKYIGEWQNDQRSGKGILYSKDGNVLKNGTWKEGEFVGPGTSN
ncbi:MAG: MORN repeat-containing protein [Chitinophagales bacterium]